MAEAFDRASEDQRERLLRVLSAATFLIFFQAYMVAPLIPRQLRLWRRGVCPKLAEVVQCFGENPAS